VIDPAPCSFAFSMPSSPDGAPADAKPVLDRRSFLKHVSAIAGVTATGGLSALWSGCTSDDPSPAVELPTFEGAEPYAAWKELRAALRRSPDHRIARAGAQVDAGDPADLLAFVRDEIALYPDRGDRIGVYSSRNVRWGARATLRGGGGTPREKAELLADLYRRAGFEADVVRTAATLTEADVRAALCRPVQVPFRPPITSQQLDAWNERIGGRTALDRSDVINEERRRALTQQVLEALPEDERQAEPFVFAWEGDIPVVRVVVDGVPHIANPCLPDGALVPETEAAPTTRAQAPFDAPTVTVTLEAARSDAPSDRFTLVEGSWPADQVAGRQLMVCTKPSASFPAFIQSRFSDLRSFVPALILQGSDVSDAETGEHAVVGDGVTLGGRRIQAEGETVRVNGRPVSAPDDAATLDAVASVEVAVRSASFPEMQLVARPLDARGRLVEGLPASAFAIDDEGEPAGFLMASNRTSMRIRVLADASLSMPAAFRPTSPAFQTLIDRLTETARSVDPDAEVKVQYGSSSIWEGLARLATSDANIIICTTDAAVLDAPTDAIRAALESGPPVFAVDVTGTEDNTTGAEGESIAAIADATGGEVFRLTSGTVEEASERLTTYLTSFQPPDPYRFSYRAATTGEPSGTERRVTLRTTDGRHEENASYVVPDERLPAPALCGLYLTVAFSSGGSHTRTLAGWPDRWYDTYDPAYEAETHGALFGHHVLAFEAGAPSPSILLDDLLSAKLTTEDLHQTATDRAQGMEALDRVLKQGVRVFPGELLSALSALPNPANRDGLTFETSLRTVLYSQSFAFGSDLVTKRLDILPSAGFRTVASSADDAFRRTLQQTAHLAHVEESLFPTSTAALLDDADLQFLEGDRPFKDDPDLSKAWYGMLRADLMNNRGRNTPRRLIPASGRPFAFWNVDPVTGALLGVLQDGSGGGSEVERIERQLEEIDKVLTVLNLAIGMLPAAVIAPEAAFSLGVVAIYGQTLARFYAAVALTLATMTAERLEERVRRALLRFACEVAKHMVLSVAGAIGNFEGAANVARAGATVTLGDAALGLTGVSADKNPLACPS